MGEYPYGPSSSKLFYPREIPTEVGFPQFRKVPSSAAALAYCTVVTKSILNTYSTGLYSLYCSAPLYAPHETLHGTHLTTAGTVAVTNRHEKNRN